jgi:hypothetical protein
MEPMMPTYRRASVVYTSLLLDQGTRYQPDAWTANDGSIRSSVDFEPGGGRCCIQGRPAALRELAAALVLAADKADQAERAELPAPVVEVSS